MGLSAIATGHHSPGIIALEDSEVMEIAFAAVAKLMLADPLLHNQFFETMSAALCREHNHSIDVGMSVECRFARFLCQLGDRYLRLGYSSKSYRLSMSRTEIGSFLGSTVESISRLVTKFNAGRIVTIKSRAVEVHDVVTLGAIGNVAQRGGNTTAVN
jgi:CRP/FNR family transcriptional regulator